MNANVCISAHCFGRAINDNDAMAVFSFLQDSFTLFRMGTQVCEEVVVSDNHISME